MATFKFKTLGCRANQYDTNVLVSALVDRGCLPATDDTSADLVLINTCAVTHTAERKSRQAIRRARREYPQARIAVMGCLPTLDRDGVETLGVDLVIANADREQAAQAIAEMLGIDTSLRSVAHVPSPFHGRTRAFVKIQDGCDHFCSYCVVAHLRGPMRSRPADEVLAEIDGFADAGHREVVLTGIRTGAYDAGIDLGVECIDAGSSERSEGEPFDAHAVMSSLRSSSLHSRRKGIDLAGLIEKIADIPQIMRIRISSIEPMDFSDRLIACVGSIDKLCPHFHIPLQSGSARVLIDMKRGYTPDEYAALLDRIRAVSPECAITTDLLMGYPSERQDDFVATKNFVAERRFSRLHVFQYSARPGTAAAQETALESERARRDRSEEMLRLSEDLATTWNRRWVGKIAEVLVEEDQGGYTPDYVHTRIEGKVVDAGKIACVRISGADSEGLRGEIEEPEG